MQDGLYKQKKIPNIGLLRIPRSVFLTGFLLFSFAWNISARGYSQERLTLKLESVKLSKLFQIIQQRTDYQFLYNSEDVQNAPLTNINVRKATVPQILSKCLLNYPLDYYLENKTVVILKRKESMPSRDKRGDKSSGDIILRSVGDRSPVWSAAFQETYTLQQFDVRGKVTDDQNKPLAGVTVSLKSNSSVGTITDKEGNYQLTLTSGNGILIFSSVGFTPKEEEVRGQSVLNVILQTSISTLDDVVLVGYSTQKKKEATGAISTVNPSDLVMSSAPDVGHMLAGKAPGLYIKQNSAQPGGGLDILIRGGGSINASNRPLFVVDGVPIVEVSQPDFYWDDYYVGGTFSPLNSLNPNDIESISVLKDAGSTAIYGSRAANGVILINTKRGKTGKPIVSYSSNYSMQPFVNKFKMLSLREWMTVHNEVSWERWLWENKVDPWGPNTIQDAELNPIGGKYSPLYTQNAIEAVGNGTDWVSLVTRTGSTLQHNLSLSGGSPDVKYFVSGNYYNQDGVLKNSAMKRASYRANLDIKVNKFVSLNTSLSQTYIRNTNSQLGDDQYEKSSLLTATLQQGPQLRARDEDGSYPVNPLAAIQPNPYSMLTIDDHSLIGNTDFNTALVINPVNHLTLNVMGGLGKINQKRESYEPTTTRHGNDLNGLAINVATYNDHYILQSTAQYDNTFSEKHNVNFVIGASTEKFSNVSNRERVSGFITDEFGIDNMGAGDGIKMVESWRTENNIRSFFGRFNYRLSRKYFFTFSIRSDGSGVFAKGHRWGYFPSAAVAWDISQESFLKSITTKISQLKLRIAYGQTGNADIGTNAFASYSAQPTYLSSGGNLLIGVLPNKLANPELTWETTTEGDVGIDYELFDGRISGSLDFYNKTVSNLLATRSLNSFMPVSSVIANFGSTQSRGFDFQINTVNVRTKNFSWTTQLSLSRFNTFWKKRSPDWKPSAYESVNDPINPMYYRLSDGILQKDGKAIAQPELTAGQVMIKDINGLKRDTDGNPIVDDNGRFVLSGAPDGRIDDADYVLLGSRDPSLVGGLMNIIKYKNFTVNLFFNAMFGRQMEDPNFIRFGLNASSMVSSGHNRMVTVVNRWTPDHPSETMPASYGSSLAGYGDFFLQKAWFIRMQDISLEYNFPHSFFNSFFSRLSIQLSTNNLFLITPYKGIDPETDVYSSAYPNMRTYNIGINVSF